MTTTRGASLVRRAGAPAPDEQVHLLGVVLPLAVTVAVLLLDVLEGPTPQYAGLVAATPFMTAALAGPVHTGFVGAVVLAAAHLTGFFQVAGGVLVAETTPHHVRIGFVALCAATAVVVSAVRVRRTRAMLDLARVAVAAQDAIVRPLPDTVGSVRCAATYVSATDQAHIGGDMVEVVDTPTGVRVLVGDVRGKGVEAVRLTGAVVGAFREHAGRAPDLPALAWALDAAVQREGGPEDFVTALLVEVHDDGGVLVVSCGHPAPYLTGSTPGRAPAVEVGVLPSPPLGLMDSLPLVTAATLGDHERLVLVTDGLLEARRPPRWWDPRSGEFIPAAAVLGAALARGSLQSGLADVVLAVRRWNRGRLADDMAVLVLEHRGRVRVPAQAGPPAGEAFAASTAPAPAPADGVYDVERWDMPRSA
ncbi:PP2C family protein-serine/threonine phosphatase [Thalassiella azotivora]